MPIFTLQLRRMNFKQLSFIPFFLLLCLQGWGRSPSDSIVKPIRTKYQYEDGFDQASTKIFVPGSSINALQRYRNRYNLGNSGLAITNLYFPVPTSSLGFSYALN